MLDSHETHFAVISAHRKCTLAWGPGPGPLALGPPARQHDAEMLTGCGETAMRKPVKKTNLDVQKHLQKGS